MAFDDTFKFVDAALNIAPNTNVYPNANKNGFASGSNALTLGRRGLSRNTQFVTIVDNLASIGDTGTSLKLVLQLSLDAGTTYRDIATHDYGDPDGDFGGERVSSVFQDLTGQEYANANILVRVQVVAVGSNTSNNTTATKIAAFLANGEAKYFGRLKTADTLFV